MSGKEDSSGEANPDLDLNASPGLTYTGCDNATSGCELALPPNHST